MLLLLLPLPVQVLVRAEGRTVVREGVGARDGFAEVMCAWGASPTSPPCQICRADAELGVRA
ncbi:hypothetical protein [Streptomyces sp. SJL17-1]|uniref:hypothetical protein n=1 Tax=Streptomyces sp. SJL17-1 TaxID=2967223 RepID=UPI0029665C0B|nr:hypothetical protein [Streptomyces sp. SJL17-1]